MARVERRKTYKEKRPFFHRKIEVTYIRGQYPTKVPIILERLRKEKCLPYLDKTKFLVPQEMNLGQFVSVIRSRLRILPTQTLYVTVAKKNIPSLTLSMSEIYASHVDEDGFLYVEYASEKMFG